MALVVCTGLAILAGSFSFIGTAQAVSLISENFEGASNVFGTGTYNYAGGKIQGTVTGNVLTFTWKQTNDRAGTGEFVMSPGNRSFSGTWKYTEPAASAGKGGSWNGSKESDG